MKRYIITIGINQTVIKRFDDFFKEPFIIVSQGNSRTVFHLSILIAQLKKANKVSYHKRIKPGTVETIIDIKDNKIKPEIFH